MQDYDRFFSRSVKISSALGKKRGVSMERKKKEFEKAIYVRIWWLLRRW